MSLLQTEPVALSAPSTVRSGVTAVADWSGICLLHRSGKPSPAGIAQNLGRPCMAVPMYRTQVFDRAAGGRR